MNQLYLRRRLFVAAAACLICGLFAVAGDEPNLTKEQIKQFLVSAKVVNSHGAKKGVTNTARLTLSDGTVTHDASFQPIDEHKHEMKLASGAIELMIEQSPAGGNGIRHPITSVPLGTKWSYVIGLTGKRSGRNDYVG